MIALFDRQILAGAGSSRFSGLSVFLILLWFASCASSDPAVSKIDLNSSKEGVTQVGDRGSVNLAFIPNLTSIQASFTKSAMKALPERFTRGSGMKLIEMDMVNKPFLENALEKVKSLNESELDPAGINMKGLLTMSPATANLDGTPLADLLTLADFTGIGGGAATLLAEMLGVSTSGNFISTEVLKQTIADNLLLRHPEMTTSGKLEVYLSDSLSDMATLSRLAGADTNGDGLDDDTGLVIDVEDEYGNAQVDENTDGYHDSPLSYSGQEDACQARYWAARICEDVGLHETDTLGNACNDLYRASDKESAAASVVETWCGDGDNSSNPNCADVNSGGYDKATNKRYLKMGGFDRNRDCLPDRYAGVLAGTYVQVDEDADGVDDITNETIVFTGQSDSQDDGEIGYGWDDSILEYSGTCSAAGWLTAFCELKGETDSTYGDFCQVFLEDPTGATKNDIAKLATLYCKNNSLDPNCLPTFDTINIGAGAETEYNINPQYLKMGTKDEEPVGDLDCFPDSYAALLRGQPLSKIMEDDFVMTLPAQVTATAFQGFDFSRKERANKDSLNPDNISMFVSPEEDPGGVGMQITGLKDSTTIDINFAMEEYVKYQNDDPTNPPCRKENASDNLDNSQCLGRDSFVGLEYDHRRFNYGAMADQTCGQDNPGFCLDENYQTDYGDRDITGEAYCDCSDPENPSPPQCVTSCKYGNALDGWDGDPALENPVIGVYEDEDGVLRWDNEVAAADNPGWRDTSQGKINYRYLGRNRVWRELPPFYLEYIVLDAAYRAYGNMVYYGLGHPFRLQDSSFTLPASSGYANDYMAGARFPEPPTTEKCHPLDWDASIFNPYRGISSGRYDDYSTCFEPPPGGFVVSQNQTPGGTLAELLWLDYDYRTFSAGFGNFSGTYDCSGSFTKTDGECLDQWGESRGFHKLYLSGNNKASEVWVGVSNFSPDGPATLVDRENPANIDPQLDGGDWVRVKRSGTGFLLSDPDMHFYMHDLVAMVAQVRLHDTHTVRTGEFTCTVTQLGSPDPECRMDSVGPWHSFDNFTHDGTFKTVRGIGQVRVTGIEVDRAPLSGTFTPLIEGEEYKAATNLDEDRTLHIEFCSGDDGGDGSTTPWCDSTRSEQRLDEGDQVRVTYEYVDRLKEGEASVEFQLTDIDLGLTQAEIEQAVLDTISSPEGKRELLDIADGVFTNASGQPDVYMDRVYAGEGEYTYLLRYYYPDGDPSDPLVAQKIALYEGITLGFYEDPELTKPVAGTVEDSMSVPISPEGGLVLYMMDHNEWIYELELLPQPAQNELKLNWERVR